MPKRDKLRQQLKGQGIVDPRLERGRRVNLFDLLKSLGVDNPRQTLTRFIRDEVKSSPEIQTPAGTSQAGSISFGPWTNNGILGFVNRTGSPIKLSDEKVRGTGTIQWRRYEGVTQTSFPITIKNGGVFEISVTNVGSSNFGTDHFYVAYKAEDG